MTMPEKLEYPLAGLLAPDGKMGRSVDTILHAARKYLGMDVAFVAEFQDDGTRAFRLVDTELCNPPLQAGAVIPLSQGYCQRVVDGRLPELITDAAALPEARALPETLTLPIGAHMSVPIRLKSGKLYGTFCCFSHRPDSTLSQRDLGMMHALAQLVAHQLDDQHEAAWQRREICQRIESVIAQDQMTMVYQPIYSLADGGGIAGVECLTRFQAKPVRTPDLWFNEADSVGMGPQLEIAAITKAVAELAALPGDFYIAVNCSPHTILSGGLVEALMPIPPQRLVIEVTEHSQIEDYEALMRCLDELRQRGMRVAIDDAGAGYASMSHIINLQPDIIKLDISLTKDIHADVMRRALAAALVEFARITGSVITAEGVETTEELGALRALGVDKAQGFFMSRPVPVATLRALLAQRLH